MKISDQSKNQKKFIASDWIAIIALFIAITFSTISLIRDCYQEKNIENLNFKLNAIKYQPRIKVIGDHKINRVWSDSSFNPFSIDQFFTKDSTNKILDIPIKVNFHIKSALKVTNIGNSIAKIIGKIYCDTLTPIPIIRNLLINQEFDKFEDGGALFPPFFQNELLPNGVDTIEIKFEQSIHFISNQKFVLHYLILYKNELGNIYDTYFWVQYELKELIFPNPFKVVKDTLFYKPISRHMRMAIKDFIKIENSKPSYHVYDIKTTEVLDKYIRQKIIEYKSKNKE